MPYFNQIRDYCDQPVLPVLILCLQFAQPSYLRFDSVGNCCGYIYEISSPRFGHVKAKPLGIYKGIECSSIADVNCHITITFQFYYYI